MEDKAANWTGNLTPIGEFDTVEDFWRWVLPHALLITSLSAMSVVCFRNHDSTSPPSSLPTGADFYLFRDGIAPNWFDEKQGWGSTSNLLQQRVGERRVIRPLALRRLLVGAEEVGHRCSVREVQRQHMRNRRRTPSQEIQGLRGTSFLCTCVVRCGDFLAI